MDVEELQRKWRRARRAWDTINQLRLEREVAGAHLSEAERSEWLQAKAEFAACEQLWDEAYRMGVVIVVGGDGEDGEEDGPYSAG